MLIIPLVRECINDITKFYAVIENTAQHNTEITNFNISDTNNNTRQRLSEIRIRGTVSARLVHASTNRPITVGCLQIPLFVFPANLAVWWADE
jgi:hypothetical protein